MNVFNETTDRRTWRILHYDRVFSCCIHCDRRGKQNHYGGYSDGKIRVPNWKLVSKRRKQWMGKPLKFTIHNRNWSRWTYTSVEW